MAGPRHGENLWLLIAYVLVLAPAYLVGRAVHSRGEHHNSFAPLSESTRREIAALSIAPEKTIEMEQSWMNTGFQGAELMSPIGPRPCVQAVNALPPHQQANAFEAFAALDQSDVDARIRRLAEIAQRDPTNLLVALTVGRELVEIGDFKNAEQIMNRSIASTNIDNEIITAAKDENSQLDLNDASVATVIHLYYTLGVAQLSSKAAYPWVALKNVIGAVRMLSRRQTLGRIPGESPESRLTIFAPGCTLSDSISSYDVYNNLIIGYMGGRYKYKEGRDEEFKRATRHSPSAVRTLFLALVPYEEANGWPNESELWALSNADTVLSERSQRPDNTRLNFNIAQLLDWWTSNEKRCPPKICTAALLSQLRSERNALLNEALTRRDIQGDQRGVFADGMLHMLADSDIEPVSVETHLVALKDWLPQDRGQIIDDLLAAERARVALPEWAMSQTVGEAPPWAPLGRNAGEWREAALMDFANGVAAWAQNRPTEERKQIVAGLRRLLDPTEAPSAVASLVPSGIGRVWFNLWTTRWAWIVLAVGAGVLVWLLTVWVLLQVRQYRLLRKSFYEIELDHIDQIDVSQPRR